MRPVPDQLMLFAAGFGTRMGALTANRPKPLIPVGGRALIDHALALADAAGIARKVVNLHYLGDQLATHLAPRTDVSLSWERDAILDTGGGLRAALPLFAAGPVMTLNTDAVWTGPNPLAALQAQWQPHSMSALLLLSARTVEKGDFTLSPDGHIARANGKAGHRYLGAQIIDPSGLARIPDPVFSLNRLWDAYIAQGRACGLLHHGGWCDVGHPKGIAEAEAMLADV